MTPRAEVVSRRRKPQFGVGWWRRLACNGGWFRFAGRRFILSAADDAVRGFLRRLADVLDETTAPPLLAFRRDFWTIAAWQPVKGLIWCALFGEQRTRLLAVWLLGRLRFHFAVPAIARLRDDPDAQLRRHVAKALRRLSAWSELREMAEHDPNAAVRAMAAHAAQPPASFSGRMTRFVRDGIREEPAARSPVRRPPLVVNVTPGVGCPPKRASFIRWILERIRRLVHGP